MADGSLLSRLSAAITETLNPSVKTMTKDQFEAYAAEQIAALAKDDPETAKKRIAALSKATEEAKKLLQENTVRISVFNPQTTAEQTTSEMDPPTSDKREAEAPEGAPAGTGTGVTPSSESPTRKFASVADVNAVLAEMLGGEIGGETGAGGEAAAGGEGGETPPADKQFPAGGGGGGGGSDDDEEDDDEEDDDEEGVDMRGGRRRKDDAAEATAKQYELVDTGNEHELFPLDMNQTRYDNNGRLVRKREPWGRDPWAAKKSTKGKKKAS